MSHVASACGQLEVCKVLRIPAAVKTEEWKVVTYKLSQ